MPDIHNPADVRNPIPTVLSDYDWLELVSFVWKVRQEGSYTYARDNYRPRFEAPAMQALADDNRKLRAFYSEHKTAADAWSKTVGGDAACDLLNAHVDEERQRREDARLWGFRCTDGYVITRDSEQERDEHAARLLKDQGKGWRVPAVLLHRDTPGAPWIDGKTLASVTATSA